MSKFLKLFLALIVVAGCSPKENSGNLTISTENGDVRYNVEEAQTPEELEKGLMNRDSLAADSGMIFNLADVENQVAMWMKDTKIPLDMLFVNSNGRIFFIEENATPMSEELIIAPEPALAVIELNAGDVKNTVLKSAIRLSITFLTSLTKSLRRRGKTASPGRRKQFRFFTGSAGRRSAAACRYRTGFSVRRRQPCFSGRRNEQDGKSSFRIIPFKDFYFMTMSGGKRRAFFCALNKTFYLTR